jgi:hypothetical protein
MTKEQKKALNAYLIEIKRELKGEERRGFALCIQEVAEWLEGQCTDSN